MKQKSTPVGICVPAFARDLLMSELGIDYKTAQAYADKLNERIESVDWLSTFQGLSFDITFIPFGFDHPNYEDEKEGD